MMISESFELMDIDEQKLNKDTIQKINLEEFILHPTIVYQKYYYLLDEQNRWVMEFHFDRDLMKINFSLKKGMYHFSYYLDEFSEMASDVISRDWKKYTIIISDYSCLHRLRDRLGEELYEEDTIATIHSKQLYIGKIMSFKKDHMLCINKNKSIDLIPYTCEIVKTSGALNMVKNET